MPALTSEYTKDWELFMIFMRITTVHSRKQGFGEAASLLLSVFSTLII